ncbi:MAG: hypothetical protein HOP14_14435 [Acidobacteria bacterium]|nr:hypothetical protein [Acidobacteriota bacterium]
MTRLNRAVQRASIYPVGHPAVTVGIGPFFEALHPLLVDGPVTMALGRTKVLVATATAPPAELEPMWFTARLFDRGVSTLTFDRDFDPEEASRLVAWLAAPAEAREGNGGAGDEDGPGIAGVRIGRFDSSRLSFTDAPVEAQASSAPAAWWLLAGDLARQQGIPAGEERLDEPGVLAARIRDALHAREGVGIAALAESIVAMHDTLASLPGDARAGVTAQLASLIGHLVPELRGSLLSVGPSDDAGKIALIEQVLEQLPPDALRQLVENLKLGHASDTGPFALFVRKLVRISMADPYLHAALETTFQQAGLPAVLLGESTVEPSTTGRSEAGTEQFVPGTYQERLTTLAQVTPGDTGYDLGGLVGCVHDDDVARGVESIALLQLTRDPVGADAAVYLRVLLEALSPVMESRLPLLASLADVVPQIVAGQVVPTTPACATDAARLQALYAAESTVDVVIEAVAARPIGEMATGARVLAAGGAAAVSRAALWCDAAPDEEPRLRVAAMLADMAPEIFRTAVQPCLATGPHLAEAMARVLDRTDPARAIDIALHLISHASPDVRVRTVGWLLATPLTSGKMQRVFQRALEDDDPRVVGAAVEAICRRGAPHPVEALRAFILRHVPDGMAALQLRAIRALGADGDEAGRQALAALLAQRGTAWSRSARRLSVEIVATLRHTPDGAGLAAIGAWRRSPAGLMSLLFGPRETA